MGMCADIIAIGPFSTNIVDVLQYSNDFYKNVKEGSIITEQLFGIMEGSTLSTEFALLLGITNPWDFNQHKIVYENINVEGLKNFAEQYSDYNEDVYKLLKLKDYGFEFHFRPEG